MDVFTLVSGGLIAFFVVGALLLGVFSKRSALEILDWKPTRSPEVEAANEVDDVEQMIAAQNEHPPPSRQAGTDARGRRGRVARVLIVPCGCRGQALARELRAAGHAVRGTTRAALTPPRSPRPAPSPTSATRTGSRR